MCVTRSKIHLCGNYCALVEIRNILLLFFVPVCYKLSDSKMSKRVRSVNFNNVENRKLVELSMKYKNIIENKKTDTVSWKEKNQIWEKIEEEFNSDSALISYRSAKVLRMKYETIKRAIKKKMSDNKAELHKTGGGMCTQTPLLHHEGQLLSVINLQVQGMANRFDSDAAMSQEDIMIPEIDITAAVHEENNIETLENEEQNKENEEQNKENEKQSKENEEQNEEREEGTIWNNWNPSQLKRKPNQLLKKTKKQRISKESLQEQISEVQKKKTILTEIQIHNGKIDECEKELDWKRKKQHDEAKFNFLLTDEERKKKEHEENMSILGLKKELLLIAIKIKQKQLENSGV